MAEQFNNDVVTVNNELRKVQSKKCRLKKQKFKSTYEQEMNEVLSYEQILKEVRQLLDPKEKPVTMYTQEDVDMLDYDEVVKAIKSIQSKKTHTRWLTPIEGDNEEYRNACRIEEMLQERRDLIRPLDEDIYIRKTDLQTIIDTIEDSGNLSQDKIVELLKGLI